MNAQFGGLCSCGPQDKCPLGAKGAQYRCRANHLRDALTNHREALTYASVVVDQVANDEPVDPNALAAAILEIQHITDIEGKS